jgi:peptidoglycan hydrolase CwlO-like protein
MNGKQPLPIDSINVDQMPQEKGWSFDEISRVVGSLVLDSHHRINIMEEQFSSISDGYKSVIVSKDIEINNKKKEIESLETEIASLKNEISSLKYDIEKANSPVKKTQKN